MIFPTSRRKRLCWILKEGGVIILSKREQIIAQPRGGPSIDQGSSSLWGIHNPWGGWGGVLEGAIGAITNVWYILYSHGSQHWWVGHSVDPWYPSSLSGTWCKSMGYIIIEGGIVWSHDIHNNWEVQSVYPWETSSFRVTECGFIVAIILEGGESVWVTDGVDISN